MFYNVASAFIMLFYKMSVIALSSYYHICTYVDGQSINWLSSLVSKKKNRKLKSYICPFVLTLPFFKTKL